jgi:xanthine dehydrogenase YagS FAD-binding subunit
MRELAYLRPRSVEEAVNAVSGDADAAFLAGGTNLVDHLKLRAAEPALLVDVRRLPLQDIEPFSDERGEGLRVGANVRNSDLAAHPVVRTSFPAVTRALLAGASGQIRHQATTAGNLLQRTRCVYFQDVTTACNKRQPGSGCSAIGGYAHYNAILGASPSCVTVHPSDLAVAMAALEAEVVTRGPDGSRRIPVAELHRLPGEHPERDTVLHHGELITAVELRHAPTAALSGYYKARDRASFAFALVSVAAGLELDGDTVRDVRIAWGGVAHKPWRATRAEEALVGVRFSEDAVREAVDRELIDATTDEGTAYKVPMVRNVTALVLNRLAGRRSES